jgi:arylsulfatase A-like enzyme
MFAINALRLIAILTSLVMSSVLQAATRPNVLWFVVDDMSPNFSSYGESTITTPNVDQLAAEGTRFSRAYVTAPVCSACRSALVTGMYQTTIGSHHHRSGRGELKINLPEDVKPIPELFQTAGYYTCIGSGLVDKDFRGLPFKDDKVVRANDKKRPKATTNKLPKKRINRLGKTDYNFEWEPSIYDSHDWSGRDKDQPFFMQVQLHGGKLREGEPQGRAAFKQRVIEAFGSAVDPASVTLPPYYPRDPVLLDDWAAYLDAVRLTDEHVGQVIARLKAEGIYENTLIIFMTDHGISHARGKQFLFDEGTHVPFIVSGPKVPKNTVRDDLIEHIDMAAVSLAAADIAIPNTMQGRNILANDYQGRDAVFAARDRCDETVERIRSVRTDKFLYIRNYFPARPHLQPNAYKDGKAIVQTLRSLHDAGTLSELSERLLFAANRPKEELYDYRNDPWQINNLAEDTKHRAELFNHRNRLDQWTTESGDQGFESEAMYDSDMAVYVGKGNPLVEKNIATMKQWASEGK